MYHIRGHKGSKWWTSIRINQDSKPRAVSALECLHTDFKSKETWAAAHRT
jgi:hypothetical protein